jgi:hypothetical protein
MSERMPLHASTTSSFFVSRAPNGISSMTFPCRNTGNVEHRHGPDGATGGEKLQRKSDLVEKN